jgi:hypothetical protein
MSSSDSARSTVTTNSTRLPSGADQLRAAAPPRLGEAPGFAATRYHEPIEDSCWQRGFTTECNEA